MLITSEQKKELDMSRNSAREPMLGQ